MRMIMLIALMALMFGGCRDTLKVSCPDCTMSSTDGVRSFECNQCSVEAEMSEDFELIQRPERG